ncbi:MAG: dihydrodipicolinate synthase family protein [Bryobacteraceae bacterium]|nr:dihydrodipicolinate synthase family protein [Bryobacteraceae bacterium]
MSMGGGLSESLGGGTSLALRTSDARNQTHPLPGGIVVPLVTPLRKGRPDADRLYPLIDHVIAGGVSGIFMLGTTGEGPGLTETDQIAVIQAAAKAIRSRVPLLVGVLATASETATRIATTAAEAGAIAAFYAGSLYYPLTESALADHVLRFIRSSPLPTVLYNIPSHARTSFSARQILRLAQDNRIVGVKDSSGNLELIAQCAADASGLKLYVGPDELLIPALAHGAHGGVTGGANLFPALYSSAYLAHRNGLTELAKGSALLIEKVVAQCYRFPAGLIPGMKSALSIFGLCDPEVAEPHATLSEPEHRSLADSLLPLVAAIDRHTALVRSELAARQGPPGSLAKQP